MAYLIEDLIIDRVDLVNEGANSASFIEFFKRKEPKENMGQKIVGKVVPSEDATLSAEEIEKLRKDLELAVAERDELKRKLEPAQEEPMSEEEIIKGLPESVRELISKMKTQKEAAEKEVIKMREAETHAEAVKKAVALKSLPIEQDKLVELVKTASQDVLDLLKASAAALDETTLTEVGKTGTDDAGNDAWAQIEAKADELVKKNKVSKAKAISLVVDENPDLYKQYLQGGAN